MSVVDAKPATTMQPAAVQQDARAPLFEARDISVAFGGIRAVDGVTFDVKEGEIFAIVGPNGAGKSTIFNLISRIYEPTGGQMFFSGEDITRVAPHERGAAMGTMSVAIDLAFGGGPLVFGLVASIAGIPTAFAVGSVIALGGAVGAVLTTRWRLASVA